jgi:exodeoxyribonuclease VII small subunit
VNKEDEAGTELELSFEDAYSELERVVEVLEQGNLTLDESIALFEQGMRLAKLCGDRLDSAELRIRALRTGMGGPDEVDRDVLNLWNERKG